MEKFNEIGKYKVVGGGFSIADEEYLKNKLYETLAEAMVLKEKNQNEKMNASNKRMLEILELMAEENEILKLIAKENEK